MMLSRQRTSLFYTLGPKAGEFHEWAMKHGCIGQVSYEDMFWMELQFETEEAAEEALNKYKEMCWINW